jgi:hypothetical protein
MSRPCSVGIGARGSLANGFPEILERGRGQERKRAKMSEPRLDDDIALGLDEEEGEDETYDTLEEKYE